MPEIGHIEYEFYKSPTSGILVDIKDEGLDTRIVLSRYEILAIAEAVREQN